MAVTLLPFRRLVDLDDFHRGHFVFRAVGGPVGIIRGDDIGPGFREQARAGHEAILALADVALLTLDDEQALYGPESAEAVAERTLALGCKEVVIKRGGEPCLLASSGLREEVFATAVPQVVDTTAAGDSFAAGYLASRTLGYSPSQAAAYAHRLSAAAIAHAGAIIPPTAMPLR